MLKKSFILCVLISLNGFIFGNFPQSQILSDLGITPREASLLGLSKIIRQACESSEDYYKVCLPILHMIYEIAKFKQNPVAIICRDTGISHAELVEMGLVDRVFKFSEKNESLFTSEFYTLPGRFYNPHYERLHLDWPTEYQKFCSELISDYAKIKAKTTEAKMEEERKRQEEVEKRQAQQLAVERAKSDQLQATLTAIQKQLEENKRYQETERLERERLEMEQKRLSETQKRFDELQKQLEVVQGQNREIMAFLTIMDQKISSVQDVVQRLDMARQVLSRPNLSVDELNLVNRRLKSLNEDIKTSRDINDEERVQLSDDISTLNALIKEKVVASLALE